LNIRQPGFTIQSAPGNQPILNQHLLPRRPRPVSGGFTPILPSTAAGDFTVADLVTFAGVTHP
jgi:hypothetical protein